MHGGLSHKTWQFAISPSEYHIDLTHQKNVDMERRDSTSPTHGVGGRKMPQRKRTIDLNDSHGIPQIALDVYKAPNGQETEDAIIAALDAGYRHIDSAAHYMNEEACGRLANPWSIRSRKKHFADISGRQGSQVLVCSYRHSSRGDLHHHKAMGCRPRLRVSFQCPRRLPQEVRPGLLRPLPPPLPSRVRAKAPRLMASPRDSPEAGNRQVDRRL
jgi:hypothetical protein